MDCRLAVSLSSRASSLKQGNGCFSCFFLLFFSSLAQKEIVCGVSKASCLRELFQTAGGLAEFLESPEVVKKRRQPKTAREYFAGQALQAPNILFINNFGELFLEKSLTKGISPVILRTLFCYVLFWKAEEGASLRGSNTGAAGARKSIGAQISSND